MSDQIYRWMSVGCQRLAQALGVVTNKCQTQFQVVNLWLWGIGCIIMAGTNNLIKCMLLWRNFTHQKEAMQQCVIGESTVGGAPYVARNQKGHVTLAVSGFSAARCISLSCASVHPDGKHHCSAAYAILISPNPLLRALWPWRHIPPGSWPSPNTHWSLAWSAASCPTGARTRNRQPESLPH